MVCHRSRIAPLVRGVALAVAAPVRAQDDPKPKPRTIVVTECVEQQYEVRRQAFRVECRPKVVESFRYETVCQPREQICTVTRRVPEMHTEIRRVCCNTW